MKKMQSIVLALSLVLVAPMAAQAAEITLVPSVKLQIGDRDNRGYYFAARASCPLPSSL